MQRENKVEVEIFPNENCAVNEKQKIKELTLNLNASVRCKIGHSAELVCVLRRKEMNFLLILLRSLFTFIPS